MASFSDLYSLSYTAVEQVAAVSASYLHGALLAKVDVESAYHFVPVQPLDRHLQAMKWEGKVYVVPMPPFGLRQPRRFSVQSPMPWIGHTPKGVRHVFHYLVIGPPTSPECAEALAVLN